MKIYYLSGTAIPSRTASTLHVMKIADALARNGHDTTVFAFAHHGYRQDPFMFYGMAPSFDLVRFRPPRLRHGLGVYFRCGFSLIACAAAGPTFSTDATPSRCWRQA